MAIGLARFNRVVNGVTTSTSMNVDLATVGTAGGILYGDSSGVVRASSSIRSECSAREVQIFWPLTT